MKLPKKNNEATVPTRFGEKGRLKALHRYRILDTPPDGAFDHVVSIAARVFSMPIALVTLVDKDRIWFKAKHGLEGVNQIPREPGLCASAILADDVYLVENAREDPRTLANPLVRGSFGLQFYAAKPLRTRDGYNIGNLCVIDKKPRYLSSEQMSLLEDFGQIVVDEMELRLQALRHYEKYQLERKLNAEAAKSRLMASA